MVGRLFIRMFMFEHKFAPQIRRASYVFVLLSECTGKMSFNHTVMKLYMRQRHEKPRKIWGLIAMITTEAIPS